MKRKKKIPYILLGPLMTFLIMSVLFALAGAFPFGKGSTAVVDGIGQYLPFMAELSQRLKGGASLFFSWNTGMGSNFWATIGYYLASPLNLIALFFTPETMGNAFSVLSLIRPVLMALTMSIFLKYAYKKNDLSIAVFSTLWATSNFMIMAMSLASWFDSIIYFPLVILGLKRMMDGKSAWFYSVFLGLAIISNFYIGWMICIFCVLYFIYYFISSDDVFYEGKNIREEDKGQEQEDNTINLFAIFKNSYLLKTFFKFIGSSLVAGAVSGIFSLPILKILGNTYKGTTIDNEYSIETSFGMIASHIFPLENSFESITSIGIVAVFAGVITIILAVAYLFNKNISKRKKLGSGFLLVIMWMSMTFIHLNEIWHGFGIPVGIAYRYAFIYTFILLTMAYDVFINIKATPLWSIFVGTGFSLFCVVSMYLGKEYREKFFHIENVIMALVSITVFTILLILLIKKPKLKNTLTAVIAVAVMIEAVSFNQIKTINLDSIIKEKAPVERAAGYLSLGESLQFEKSNKEYNNIVPFGMFFNYRTLSAYSSLADGNFVETSVYLGSYGNSINATDGSNQQTPVFNIVLPTNYFFSKANVVSQSFYREKVEEFDGYELYRQKYTMPFMYTVNKDMAFWNPFSYGVVPDAQNSAFKAMTGGSVDVVSYCENKDFVYENCKPVMAKDIARQSAIENNVEYDGAYDNLFDYLQSRMTRNTFEIADNKKESSISYKAVAQADGIMYIMLSVQDFCDASIKINGKTFDYYVYGNDDERIYELGEVKKGDVAEIIIGGYDEEKIKSDIIYNNKYEEITSSSFVIKKDEFINGYEKLDNMSDTRLITLEDTYVKAQVKSYEDGMLYIPMANDKGWTLYIDGVETETVDAPTHIFMAPIREGDHTIELKYMPEGFVAGAVLTGVSTTILIGWGVVLLIKKKTAKKGEK